jgi:hypothetical protein
MQENGKHDQLPMMIENCHNGGPAGNIPHYDEHGELQCPFHTYRSSTDIRPVYGSILVNLLSVPPLAEKNLSVPGCWAYPGMHAARGIGLQLSSQHTHLWFVVFVFGY